MPSLFLARTGPLGLLGPPRWDEMPCRISDEMLETSAIVGTFDTLADKIKRRYGGFSTRIEFGLPIRGAEDCATLRRIVQQIQG
jgi:hypothetical protein